MRLSAPTKPVWLIAVILGVLGILGAFAAIPFVTEYHFWLVVIGFVLLTLATLLDGF